jgi:2-dehydro-3-deoxy-D-arabinonate dehydratase
VDGKIMRVCKVQLSSGAVVLASLEGDRVKPIAESASATLRSLSDYLHSDKPLANLQHSLQSVPLGDYPVDQVKFLAPIDAQEIWAAGVTYKRSQEARERESAGAAKFYDLVYSAPRPELFFKSTANRVAHPGDAVHIRRDSKWNVPEPELALVISPKLKLVGFTIGNDMSSRDIEGENPLYLPQAKFYDRACAVGPCITLIEAMPKPDDTTIRLTIERSGKTVFDGATKVSAMKRTFDELIDWLGKETSFPDGAILLTGTGVVPPDDFTLAVDDIVHIDITGIGRLTNVIAIKS